MSNEPLSEVIRIRVTHTQSLRLAEAAALSGLSLSDYVRRRLTAADTITGELELLRQAVQHLGQLTEARAGAVEAALLVRTQARPEHVAAVQADMLHLGITPLARSL